MNRIEKLIEDRFPGQLQEILDQIEYLIKRLRRRTIPRRRYTRKHTNGTRYNISLILIKDYK